MSLNRDVSTFFDAFVTAFSRFNGNHIAERYLAPYLALQADGTTQCFTEQAAIGEYFQGVVEAYHAQGCRSCRYLDLDLVPLGKQSALATVTWELLHGDGSILVAWRESYNLLRTESGWRIFVSVDHVA